LNTFKSPGHDAYYFGVSVKWIKMLLDAPELKELGQSGTPFWDSHADQQPFFMQVVFPVQNKDWSNLKLIAQAWKDKEPTTTEASYYLALAEENLGETMAAQQLYEQTLKSNPKHTACLVALARIAKKQGNEQELQRLTLLIKDLNSDAAEELVAGQQ
jgi:tetratricopeptide (TPR) repeat protein